jgi:hypothetical protein
MNRRSFLKRCGSFLFGAVTVGLTFQKPSVKPSAQQLKADSFAELKSICGETSRHKALDINYDTIICPAYKFDDEFNDKIRGLSMAHMRSMERQAASLFNNAFADGDYKNG